MSRALRPAEGLVWVKDATQIIVIHVASQTAHLLQGEEMVVWDWLMLGYSFDELAFMLAELRRTPLTDARQQLESLLQAWVEAGLLQGTEQADG